MSEIPTPTEQEVSAARAALDPLCRWWLRRRLDVPAVHNLLRAQQRMLDNWAETEAGSPDRNRLWRELHYAGDVLADLTYGGAPWWQRVGYWLRPYDGKADRRRWRWQPTQCQRDQETARQILAVMRAGYHPKDPQL